jgi:hypothetical protein
MTCLKKKMLNRLPLPPPLEGVPQPGFPKRCVHTLGNGGRNPLKPLGRLGGNKLKKIPGFWARDFVF